MLSPEVIVAIIVPVIGGGVWLIRLEGRVNVNEALQKRMAEDLSYVRQRIDHALNGHDD